MVQWSATGPPQWDTGLRNNGAAVSGKNDHRRSSLAVRLNPTRAASGNMAHYLSCSGRSIASICSFPLQKNNVQPAARKTGLSAWANGHLRDVA